MSSIALVDCNNFFVSCERLFNPQLRGRPVVVLSNNDGCIIARSNEAKALGIPMGAPLFEWANFLKAHDVITCSSNFALYGDISHRVMRTLAHFNPELEIYSVDEAFLAIGDQKNPEAHSRLMRQKVLQWTGIPVSIGIATTKTLAKVANHRAKKMPAFKGVYAPSPCELNALLEKLPVDEIWGIGRRLTQFLAKRGIFTAKQLRDKEDVWIRKNLTVTGLRTVWELRGISCLPLEEVATDKQSIMTSRTFGRPIQAQEELNEAVARYVARGAKKVRRQKSVATTLQVFLMGKEERRQAHFVLPEPTSFTPSLIAYAKRGIAALYRDGCVYKKAGVLLGGLVPEAGYQRDLFCHFDPHKEVAMRAFDRANDTFGYPVLQFAAEGIAPTWEARRQLRSPCFTTRWDELLKIKI